ncbi:pyridoxal phosphate-dependent aminotransferase [Propionibacteriaceae bacterium Y1700]|uniref:pyridoxal phosphate-dependent aminotransferase n=1 Tax=Microlunatus sp. Y1700 TaxID=3418487 RepID=UPI003DA75AA1
MHKASVRGAVAPFGVMEVLKAATDRQRTHGDAIMLCVGQPSTPAPAEVRAAAQRAIDSELLGYSEAAGILELREAIAAHHRADGLEVEAGDVAVTTGSSGGFTTLFLAAFDVGDTVVMARPGYPAYRNTLQAMGCEVIELDCGPDIRHQPTLEMISSLPQRPDGVIIASPSNPTGTIIDADELGAIARWCETHDVLLISDEIYHHISYGRECRSAWHSSRQAAVIGSVSKYFSMTGWRLGWMLLPPHLRRSVELLSGNLSLCPPVLSQHAAIAAFTDAARAELDTHVRRYAENRQILLERLPECGFSAIAPADGAFYLWCDISDLTDDSEQWCADVLARTGVAIAPGTDFDTVAGQTHVRLSFAGTAEQMIIACDRLQSLLG